MASSPPAPSAPEQQRDFALAPRLRARLMGLALAVIGVVLLVSTVVVSLWRLPPDILSALVILTVAAVFGIGATLVRRWPVLRLTGEGYRVRRIRGVGCDRGRWADVDDLSAVRVQGARCVVLRLRDGRTTTIPVDAVEGDPDALVTELTARLDRGHGYRRMG